MPEWGYSVLELDPEKTAKASGRELRVSPKSTREVCNTIKGMKLDQARNFLRQVILKKKPVPFRRHKKKVGHRRGLQKADAGRYPA
ncbi:MAG: 50S ribosomal protein L22, partial [Candidatus Korarchaeota archaeon]|nr:50S ribosomal protein L22 [Candidatus Thorarchaeota archaeon]NIW52629.1 50S ribosomal protein L22 [Candidatus Korarchaeota archaeon]